MDEATLNLVILLALITAAVVSLLALRQRGVLSLRRLAALPERKVHFPLSDVALALLGSACGLAAVGFLMGALRLDPADDHSLSTYALILVIVTLGTHLPVLAVLGHRLSKQPAGPRALGLVTKEPGRDMAVGAIALAAVLPLVFIVNMVMTMIATAMGVDVDPIQHAILDRIKDEGWSAALLLILIVALVIVPVLEEITFRGFLQTALVDSLDRSLRWLAILVTAVLFTLVHGFPWHVVPGFMILAIGFGIAYERRGSLWTPIVMHSLFNLINVVMTMLMVSELAE